MLRLLFGLRTSLIDRCAPCIDIVMDLLSNFSPGDSSTRYEDPTPGASPTNRGSMLRIPDSVISEDNDDGTTPEVVMILVSSFMVYTLVSDAKNAIKDR